jgi:predicted ATPase
MASEVKPIVGRAAEITYLEQSLETALTGERQVVFVSGEPGIGKTTIVDAFLQSLESSVKKSSGFEVRGPNQPPTRNR